VSELTEKKLRDLHFALLIFQDLQLDADDQVGVVGTALADAKETVEEHWSPPVDPNDDTPEGHLNAMNLEVAKMVAMMGTLTNALGGMAMLADGFLSNWANAAESERHELLEGYAEVVQRSREGR
jgi:hypothetical protein